MSLFHIKIRKFKENDNENIWEFLINISCYSIFGGLLKTSFNKEIPYNYNLSYYSDKKAALIAEKEDNQETLGIVNYAIKTIKDNENIEKNMFLFGLKIDPLYMKKEIEKLFLNEIIEIISKKKLKITRIYSFIKDFEKTTMSYYANLGFKEEKSFDCIIESTEKYKLLNESNLKSIDENYKMNKLLDREKIAEIMKESKTNNPKILSNLNEISNLPNYLGCFYLSDNDKSNYIGINLWKNSQENVAHITKFIIPIEYYFSRWSLPVLLIIMISFFLMIFIIFENQASFLFVLIMGLFLGICFVFLKLRGLFYAKRKPILYLFYPFHKGIENEKIEALFKKLLYEILKIFHKEKYFYFKIILPENHCFLKVFSKLLSSNGAFYSVYKYIYEIPQQSLENKEKSINFEDFIDPRDI